MKPIGVYGKLDSEWKTSFAWLPVYSDESNKRIWLTRYWMYVIKIDNDGFVPRKNKSWQLIYTREEYILKKLRNE